MIFKKQMVQRSSVISITGFPVRIPTPEDLNFWDVGSYGA